MVGAVSAFLMHPERQFTDDIRPPRRSVPPLRRRDEGFDGSHRRSRFGGS
jgi:hypothetical protein